MISQWYPQKSNTTVADNFWPQNRELRRSTHSPRTPLHAASNLYELFVHELSLLVSGACQTDRMARIFFSAVSSEQIRLRQLVLGLAQSARGCLPDLPPALVEDGLVLNPARDRVIDALLRPANPQQYGTISAESSSVVNARTVSAFSEVAQHFESATTRAAEDARLLGSDRLHDALVGWASVWSNYLHDLRQREQSFRAQAYAAGLDAPAWRQIA